MKKILLGLLLIFAFVGCSGLSAKPEKNLIGKEYVLSTSTEQVKITINFAEENFFGFSGVNNYFGKYIVSGDTMKLSHVGSTLMAGPKEAMDKEFEFTTFLSKVEKYRLEKDKLILISSDGEQLIFNKTDRPSKK